MVGLLIYPLNGFTYWCLKKVNNLYGFIRGEHLTDQIVMMKKTSFFKKFITCFVAALTSIALLLVLGNSGTLKWFPPVVVFSLVALCFLFSVIYPFIWQSREKHDKIDSEKMYGFFYAVIRYTIAFDLAGFGWKKLFGLQFVVPDSISDMPMNQQSGEWLTWYYFGHSYVFGAILAFIQIVGSYLLLFRRTLLAASFALFAFMLNLTLINIFYQMNAGALTQSILLTIGIVFLISLEYKRLVEFFFTVRSSIPTVQFNHALIKNLFRLSAILLSLLFTLYLRYVFLAN
jgi:hypothetical protein